MSITDTTLAGEAGYAPGLDLAQRLDSALGRIGAPELAGLILTAGLAAVYEQLQRTRAALGRSVDSELALRRDNNRLTKKVHHWKRRHAGAVAQARREHARAENLQSVVDSQVLAHQSGVQHRAELQHKHDQAHAVLRHVLGEFTEAGHPGYSALRSRWVSVQQVDAWREAVAFTPQRPWWEQLKELSQENEQLRGRLFAERTAIDELLAERTDLQLAISELQGAKARTAATEATEQLPLPVHFSAAMLRQAASAIADEADRGEKAGVVRIYLRELANKLRQAAEACGAAHVNQAIDELRQEGPTS